MATPRSHLAPLPPGFITLRIFQLIGAVITLALTAFVTANVLFIGELITLPSAILTLILLVWMTTAENCAPKAYNYWAILAFEIFMFLLWADALGWMIFDSIVNASWFADSWCSFDYYYYCTSSQLAVPNVIYAATAFTAIMFIFFLTSLIVVSVSISRHRAAGGHSKLGSAPTAPLYDTNQYHNQYQGYPVAGTSATLDLQQQNLALQRQYLTLQQQHLELQRRSGITTPAPVHVDSGLQSVENYPEAKGPTAMAYS